MPHANTQFHAIGQGCFYSGEIFCTPNSDPLRFVYDCGSETGRDPLEREIALFHQIVHDAKLDVLILSHLDADHVNGLALLLDNGLTARNVFLPYLTPAQRAIVAAGTKDGADPSYFEFLANPVNFLQSRGVENIIFISGGEDELDRSNESDDPPFGPWDEGSNPLNLGDLEDDIDGKMFAKSDESKLLPTEDQLSQPGLPLAGPPTVPVEDSRPAHKAALHFKTDRRPFRLTRCWQGKFFHRDDMRRTVGAISDTLDFTIRPFDSTSVQRYKRFLGDVHGRFGTLDAARLVSAIRDQSGRKKLRACYHHICGNHNDVSLVLWHGPIPVPAFARLNSGARHGWKKVEGVHGCNGGTLLTGDLTCTNRVVQNIERHFRRLLPGSAFLQVPHHGSVHSWNTRLLSAMSPEVLSVISAGLSNSYRHPHPQVIDALERTNGRARWFVNDERNTVAMHIQTI